MPLPIQHNETEHEYNDRLIREVALEKIIDILNQEQPDSLASHDFEGKRSFMVGFEQMRNRAIMIIKGMILE
jgi:hypothetical protein